MDPWLRQKVRYGFHILRKGAAPNGDQGMLAILNSAKLCDLVNCGRKTSIGKFPTPLFGRWLTCATATEQTAACSRFKDSPVCLRTYATSEVDCDCRLKKKACLMAPAEHASRPNVAQR